MWYVQILRVMYRRARTSRAAALHAQDREPHQEIRREQQREKSMQELSKYEHTMYLRCETCQNKGP
jgi:hypothetical protein